MTLLWYNIIEFSWVTLSTKGGVKGMEQFTLRLKKDDLEKVKAIAKEQDRSINYVIAGIVAKSLRGAN